MAAPNTYCRDLMNGVHDHENDTIRVALGGSGTAYTFDEENHEFVDDVFDNGTTAEEIDYNSPSDRETLSNVSVTIDAANDDIALTADTTTFSSLSTTQDIQFALVYKQVGSDDTTPGDDPIIAVYDDDSATQVADFPLPTNGSNVQLEWNNGELFYLDN